MRPASWAALRSKNELKIAIFENDGPDLFFFSDIFAASPDGDTNGADFTFCCDFLFPSAFRLLVGELRTMVAVL